MSKVTLADRDGNTITVDADQVGAAATQGFHPQTGQEASDRVVDDVERERYGGPAGTVVGGAAAVARGATLGLSDAAISALGGGRTLQKLQEYNPTVSTAGNVVGTLLGAAATGGESLLADSPAAAVSRLGAGISERAGGGIYGAIKAGAAEGGLYGAGNAVSELAMSDDPLTAEHVASTLSSNVLFGTGLGGLAGGAFKVAERALTRTGTAIADATAARAAVDGVPEDLAGLDAKGLREAAQTERASIKAQAETERAALEEARVPQREQVAREARELHDALAKEAPISKAVQGADVGGIEGVKDIRVQLAKSYSAMRTAFDSPLSIARDPGALIRPLEMRQVALETLQSKVPELEQVLAGDARGAALRHVDDALAETKDQIARIRELSKSNPVTSPKLTDLGSNTSPRLKAIEAAQDALANAPEKGGVQKAVEGAAFGGGTALAHMIPGVGIAAPFVGKGASEMVGRLFEHLAGAGGAVAKQTNEAARTFLDGATKVRAAVQPLASKTLAAVRFAPSSAETTGGGLPELFSQRSAELRSQTMYAPDGSVQMRPDARAALSKRLDPIAAVNPVLADKIETIAARKVAFLSSKLPRQPDVGGMQIGPNDWKPSDMEIRTWARYVAAAEDPAGVETRLAHGTVTPEDAEAYRACYPERFAALQQHLTTAAPSLSRTLPYARRLSWSVFAGVPIDPSMEPNVLAVLQGSFAKPPPSSDASVPGLTPPKATPVFGSLGSMKSLDKPTTAQQRAAGAPA